MFGLGIVELAILAVLGGGAVAVVAVLLFQSGGRPADRGRD